jgi:RNA polymerase subunit RPABC4/transcription elongation factor Spt4
MSESDFNISLKGNADAVYASLAKRKEFYITVQNLTENYMPQVRVKLTVPPQVKLVVKSEWYGGIAKHYSKNRLFTIMVRENGVYNITATLTTKKGHNITFPFVVQAGTTQAQAPTGTISLLSKPIVDKPVSNVNCPYCHTEISQDAKFCPHCGAGVEEKLKEIHEKDLSGKHCANCGVELLEEAKFCAKCGSKVQ